MMDIDAWEHEVLRNFREDYLACIVQLMRTLGWAAIGLDIPRPLRDAMLNVDHRDPHSVDPTVAGLDGLSDGPVFATLLRHWQRVRDALVAGPHQPPERELLVRYLRGELGDCTVRHILAIDSWELIERCRKYGFPPIQIGPEWKPSDD